VDLAGWESWQRQTPGGAVESEQRVSIQAPVVGFDGDGARRLGRSYWEEVQRTMRGLVRVHRGPPRLELRLLGGAPLLLSFDEPELEAGPTLVCCRYPVAGGALTQRPAGEISFAQIDRDGALELRSTIRDFFPTLAARDGGPHWTGTLYNQVQSRVHVAISRRYFARLIDGAAR
jgi:hypothetical protein